MRKVTHLVIAALALQFFVGGVSAEAAPAPLRISGVTVSGLAVTVKWNPVVITSKDFFEVEFTKSSSTKAFKVIKTKHFDEARRGAVGRLGGEPAIELELGLADGGLDAGDAVI